MLGKHQQNEIDTTRVDKMQKKADSILKEFPRINELEKSLDIQDNDAELA